MPLTVADLEKDLQEVQKEKDDIISDLDNLFQETDLLKAENQNYISYGFTEDNVQALFSIDNDTFKFSSYITVEKDTGSSTFSEKGEMSDIEQGARKFLSELNDMVNF